jgi:hypothetical protein
MSDRKVIASWQRSWQKFQLTGWETCWLSLYWNPAFTVRSMCNCLSA